MRRGEPASLLASICLALALFATACGDDDDGSGEETTTPAAAELGAIKAFLTDHTARLVHDAAAIREDAEAYHRLAEAAGFDYEELADYDVIIDAGGDARDPENAVPFDIETPDGRTFEQPGNFNYLIETSAFGTDPKFQAKGVTPDLDVLGRRVARDRPDRGDDRGTGRSGRVRDRQLPAGRAYAYARPPQGEDAGAGSGRRGAAG